MAAGMWPVGFLFGACSACCDECGECPECTHYNKTNGECYDIPFLTPSPFTWSYTAEGIGTVTVPCVTLEPSTGCDDNALDIPLEMLPAFEPPAEFVELGGACITSGDFERPASVDECGCNVCGYGISLIARIFIDPDNELRFERYFLGTLGDCDQSSINMVGQGEWQLADAIASYDYTDFISRVLEFLNGLNITMSLTSIPPCCNKCTHYFNECPNMDPYGDPNSIELSFGDYGVVTGLNDTVEGEVEDGPLEGWTFRSFIREYVPCPSETECGCNRCGFAPSLEMNIFAPLSDENPFGTQNVTLLFEPCGFLDDCDQTEIVFSGLTEWGYFDELSVGVSEAQIADAISWANENVQVSYTNGPFEPCDCGACCDDGCEDNVAEGGCGNWAGVGTSCCDDPCEE